MAHAGDGNIHPILLFDERDPGEVERAVAAGRELLEECIACGGSITAEHGIGARKDRSHGAAIPTRRSGGLERVRYSFDPYGLFNPGKAD